LPVLLGFGAFASALSGRLTHQILRYSGVMVLLLGLVMVNRGVALAGTGYDLNTIVASTSPSIIGDATAQSDSVKMDGKYQLIYMNVTASGWSPSRFVLKKGVPVKWVIDGQEITSCNNAIQVPKYGLKFDVKKGLQTIEFTPDEAGIVPWSCWMGMITGTFEVVQDNQVQAAAPTTLEPATTDYQVSTTTTERPTNTSTVTVKPQKSGNYQEIRMNVTYAGWQPDRFVLKAGVPVKWVIDAQQLTSCNSAIKVPQFDLQFNIKPGIQTIEFTPTDEGTIPWSCWMGMIRGTFIVKKNIDTADQAQVQKALDAAPYTPEGMGSCNMGSGGCSCGMMG
jgi:plastocyanin domain-containing protein